MTETMTQPLDTRETRDTSLTRPSWRKLGAAVCAVVLGVAALSGCGSESAVPLPGFHTANKIGGSADTGFWSVLLQLTDASDTPVEDYAAQLTDAGYTVEDGSGGKEATNDTWDVSFHSSMAKTLTISVIES